MDKSKRIVTIRHQSVFDAGVFGNLRVDVIGCGATGSQIAMQLAKLGIKNLHLWDFDIVEAHNCANQLFYLDDVDKQKVEALGEHIQRATGLSPTLHNERVDGSQELGDVVFLLTDTMSSRKEIWENGIADSLTIKLMIETRMGVDDGKIYTINPQDIAEGEFWESTLCEDTKTLPSACGGKTSVGPTASLICGCAVWSFIQWFAYFQKEKNAEKPAKQLFFGIRPEMSVITDSDLLV
ncbi:MAG: ThiF family adenylyltransferase [Candidatus Peribacteria bacterium]|jgi:molybdopterin/thiamine biosynthesis adenylyltransferase|nr:ThiF family adenylyltransferase [Candidatus Peribacteria bacterium]